MSEHPTVYEAWSRVMAAVQSVGKNDYNDHQKFNFRGIDAVVNAVGPALRSENAVVVPFASHIVADERYTTAKGAAMRGVTLNVIFRVYGPHGDYFEGQACGEASDSGDKAIPKAHSVAYRTFLLQSLCIPTDEPDPDSESHERVAEAPEQPLQPGDAISAEKLAEVKAFAKRAGFNFWEVASEVFGAALDGRSITNDEAKRVCQEIADRKKAKA